MCAYRFVLGTLDPTETKENDAGLFAATDLMACQFPLSPFELSRLQRRTLRVRNGRGSNRERVEGAAAIE